jgi:KipI family sensor histidine kinase inhibitor
MQPRISPMGDTAVLIEWEGDPLEVNRLALAIAAELEHDPLPGMEACVPAVASLLVCFNPLQIAYHQLVAHLQTLIARPRTLQTVSGRLVTIDVRFGGEDGPDLTATAAQLGMAPDDLIARLCAHPLRVMMIGFAAGFPYLGPLPEALHLPRRATPRAAVPERFSRDCCRPGRDLSGQTARGLARTRTDRPAPVRPAPRDPPTLLSPGDQVQVQIRKTYGH